MEAKSKQPGSLRTSVPVSISIEPGLLPVILGPADGSVPGWIPGKTYFRMTFVKVICGSYYDSFKSVLFLLFNKLSF